MPTLILRSQARFWWIVAGKEHFNGGESTTRKLAGFLIFVLIAAFGIAVAAAYDPNGFGAWMKGALDTIGGGTTATISGGIMTIATFAAADVTHFVLYSLGIVIAAGIVWTIFLRKVWRKRPEWMGNKPAAVATQPVYQAQLSTPELYTASAQPVAQPQPVVSQPVIVQKKTEEAAAQ